MPPLDEGGELAEERWDGRFRHGPLCEGQSAAAVLSPQLRGGPPLAGSVLPFVRLALCQKERAAGGRPNASSLPRALNNLLARSQVPRLLGNRRRGPCACRHHRSDVLAAASSPATSVAAGAPLRQLRNRPSRGPADLGRSRSPSWACSQAPPDRGGRPHSGSPASCSSHRLTLGKPAASSRARAGRRRRSTDPLSTQTHVRGAGLLQPRTEAQ